MACVSSCVFGTSIICYYYIIIKIFEESLCSVQSLSDFLITAEDTVEPESSTSYENCGESIMPATAQEGICTRCGRWVKSGFTIFCIVLFYTIYAIFHFWYQAFGGISAVAKRGKTIGQNASCCKKICVYSFFVPLLLIEYCFYYLAYVFYAFSIPPLKVLALVSEVYAAQYEEYQFDLLITAGTAAELEEPHAEDPTNQTQASFI